MNILKYFIVSILLFPVAASSENSVPIDYIGSYTKLRFSKEHAYISEVWLWQRKDQIIGLYIDGSALEGDPYYYMVNLIENTTGNIGQNFSFNTKYFKFTGKFIPPIIEGLLTKGSEIIWGGIEGSNVITFTKGTSITKIKNPEGSYKTYSSWLNWVDTLNELH